jgi:outer membrane protein assembly factor BamC
VDEGFDRAWRRVGLALDRAGFTVEDRDRTQGIFRALHRSTPPRKTLLLKLFSWGSSSDKDKEAQRYRVRQSRQGSTSLVSILSNEGKPDVARGREDPGPAARPVEISR